MTRLRYQGAFSTLLFLLLMVKDKTQVCKFLKQKPSSSQLSPCKTHSPITAHTNCQRGEELEKLDCLD